MPNTSVPDGFILHDGGECPVFPDQYVEMLVRTGEGLGSSGIIKAKLQHWEDSEHEGGYGAVVAYRLAQRKEPPLVGSFERLNDDSRP
jgi:hypothetical protein